MIDVLILCGGFGTRLNNGKPGPLKPLIKINDETILEKIIKIYSRKLSCRFIILGGYKFNELAKFIFKKYKKNPNVIAVNTGKNTQTGGRILKAKKHIRSKNFCVTYGDSLANFNVNTALKIKKNNFLITLYKYKFPYGTVKDKKNKLYAINEKNNIFSINAGFYIFDKRIFKFIKSNKDSLEKDVIKKILKNKIIFHANYIKKWMPMDTYGNRLDLLNILKKNTKFFN